MLSVILKICWDKFKRESNEGHTNGSKRVTVQFCFFKRFFPIENGFSKEKSGAHQITKLTRVYDDQVCGDVLQRSKSDDLLPNAE